MIVRRLRCHTNTEKVRLSLLFILVLFVRPEIVVSQENTPSIEYGVFLLEKNKLPQAEKIFQAVVNSKKSNFKKNDSYYEIAKLYNRYLYFDLSIEYCQEVINTNGVSKKNSKRFLHLISINHLDLNNFDQAEKYFWKAEKYRSNIESEKSNDYNLIGEIKRLKKESLSAINYFNRAIFINKKIDSFESLAMNYNNLGLVFLEQKKYTQAEEYLNTSLRIIDSLGIKERKVAIGISFGRLNQAQDKLKVAIDYFAETFNSDLYSHPDKTELLRDANKGLSECYGAIGDSKQALIHYMDYQRFNQMIFDRDKQASIFENRTLFEKEAHKSEIKLIEEKALVEKKYSRVYLILLCIGITFLSLFVFLLRLRNKSMRQKVELIESNNRIQQLKIENSKALNEKLQSEIREKEQSRKIEDLELQKLKSKIDFKNRELTSSAVHLSNKNEVLSEIDSKIKSLENWEDNPKLKELNILIKQNFQLDQDWNIFKKHFIEVHPDFFKALVNQFPNLTNDDLKLCAYLKLQLSSKEIARLLNIETTAVNKRRNRIRKKLNIDSSVDLHEFMLTIDKS